MNHMVCHPTPKINPCDVQVTFNSPQRFLQACQLLRKQGFPNRNLTIDHDHIIHDHCQINHSPQSIPRKQTMGFWLGLVIGSAMGGTLGMLATWHSLDVPGINPFLTTWLGLVVGLVTGGCAGAFTGLCLGNLMVDTDELEFQESLPLNMDAQSYELTLSPTQTATPKTMKRIRTLLKTLNPVRMEMISGNVNC